MQAAVWTLIELFAGVTGAYGDAHPLIPYHRDRAGTEHRPPA